ncbi:Heterokaryon incompatibility protein (HET) domain containing protein [Rhypophila sp. PSN 637]
MTFAYPSAASSDELRLLEPVSITHSNLHFNFIKVPRLATPRYTAVSYTWGDGEASEIIYLNNRQFRVRVNLWSCLHYVGQHAKSIGVRLWVDAICIDQNNMAERNVQVRRMDETYKQAAHVSVWLGLPSIPDHIRIPDQRKPIKTADIEEFEWCDHLEDLANRPYWSRIWVIQECLLPESIILFCGNTMMQWTDFQDILCNRADVMVTEFDDPVPSPAVTSVITSFAALPLAMARHVDKHPELLQSLHDLLISHHRAECKDPRDKIFGLLGLVTLEERGFLERFFPDYTMSEDHVQIIALAHVLQYNVLHGAAKITTESNELFLGLGVKSGTAERRRLLERASLEKFNYISDWGPGQASAWLTGLENNTIRPDLPRQYGNEYYHNLNEGAALLSAVQSELQARWPELLNNDERYLWGAGQQGSRGGRALGVTVVSVSVAAAVALVLWRYGVLDHLFDLLGT